MGKAKIVPYINFKKDSLIDCFGIQPIFSEQGKILKSNVFSIEKEIDPRFEKVGTIRYKLYNDLKEIERNLTPYYMLHEKLLNLITTSRRFYWPQSVDDFLKLPKEKIIENIKTNSFYMYYWNKMHYGNRFISSNEELLDHIRINRSVLHCHKALVSPDELKPNCLIVGCKGSSIADNGIILSPIIDKDEYMEWLDKNNLSEDIKIDPKDRYPLLRKWGKIYGYYEAYINENIPQMWYVLKTKKWHNFYMTLVFT